jgi:hypothetical protein
MKQTLVLLLILWASVASGQTGQGQEGNKPIHQLRVYEVPKENKQVFHERFRDHAHRIMKKYGFHIVATWESTFDNKVEFVYLLEWPDEATMKSAWSNFMADQEWKDIKAETGKKYGTFVNHIEDRTLILTDYSPQKILLKP